MKLEEAIDFWVTENGHRQIQTLFSIRTHAGTSKYALTHFLERESLSDLSEASDAIETLQDAMEVDQKDEMYYHGSPSLIQTSHIREGFLSLTKDLEKAASYGVVYKVILDKNVPRLSFQREGGETLVKDGMMYQYDNGTIYITTPTGKAPEPYLGNLYQSQKQTKNRQSGEKADRIVNMLYCHSFEIPEEDIGYIGEYDDSCLDKFRTLPFSERLQKLQTRMKTLPNKQEFLNFMAIILQIDKKELVSLVEFQGGKRKTRHRSRRSRRSRRTSKRRI
jgi:hypothetical protein